MVVVGVALLLLLLTWIHGASATMLRAATGSSGHVRVVMPEYSAREQLGPSKRTSRTSRPSPTAYDGTRASSRWSLGSPRASP
jgi:hypothetical protein